MIRWDHRADGIVVLTLDDPEQNTNTMNARYVAAMTEATERLVNERDGITGVVVTSAKDSFLAGADLKELTAGVAPDGETRRRGRRTGSASRSRTRSAGWRSSADPSWPRSTARRSAAGWSSASPACTASRWTGPMPASACPR